MDKEKQQKIMLVAVIVILFYGLSVVDTVQTQSSFPTKTTTIEKVIKGGTEKVVTSGSMFSWLAAIPLIGGMLASIFQGIGALFIGLAVYKNSTIIIVLGIIVALIFLIKMLKK